MATDLHPMATLSEREMAVLRLMAAGKTNPEIAEALGIRFETAKWYVSEVLQKLQVPSREAAAAEYRRYNRAPARLRRALAGVPPLLRWGAAATAVLATAAVVLALNVPERRDTQEAQWLVAYVEGDQPGIEPEPAPIRIVEVKTGARWDLGEPDTWGAVAWSPSGDRLLAIRHSGQLSLLAYPDGTILDFDAPAPNASLRLYDASWSPDGRRFFVARTMFNKDGDALWTFDQSVQYAMWAPGGRHIALALADRMEIVETADGSVVFQGEALPQSWLTPTQLGVGLTGTDEPFPESVRILDLSASTLTLAMPDPSFDVDQLLIGQIPGVDYDVAKGMLETVAAGEPVSIVLGGASYGTALTVVGQIAERLGAPPNPVGILVTDGQEVFGVDAEPLWSIPGVQGRWGPRVSFVIRD